MSVYGQDLFIRMVAPDVQEESIKRHRKIVAAVTTTVLLILMVFVVFFCIYMRRRKFKETALSREKEDEAAHEAMELPFFNFATIANATNDFSIDKKLGEGGFGPVYMGTLEDGQEIAVKKLAHSSGQGMKEFKNEVILCSKLQHRNLVKLLGCCIQGHDKMLIYEYMLNKSLDYFLFDSYQSKCLDWTKRRNIIFGIARGLLYLHQDSRMRIIHRDLKASNILLDSQLLPKISDFGLAKIFGGDQIEGNTNRVAGTYGYMAPEYASDGAFSIKSDVFSYGILLLEIISSKRNRGVYHTNVSLNLIGHAWKLWKEGSAMELVDACLEDSFVVSEVLRYIHIGLLCVQQNPDDRPDMASVVVMLSSECALPRPKEPGFLMERASVIAESSSSKPTLSSTNEMSFTHLAGR
ncbi:hypothetical protein L6164_023715 [Bauhinia variegata]|uniref:Uncharacterized protein n=1 Tax=Bauhinia variegata TaxID=167791 RepID=A0ACB9MKG6_BAUVA|nr:hypothetical protein L6164_023715 [Bauhinia variegata]